MLAAYLLPPWGLGGLVFLETDPVNVLEGLLLFHHLVEDLRHVMEILKEDDVPAQTGHERCYERPFFQVVESSPQFVDQVAAPHRASVGGARLDTGDRLYALEGLGDLLRGPGSHPPGPYHSHLQALGPHLVDGLLAGVGMGA